MDTEGEPAKEPKRNPLEKANFLSELTFAYMFPIFKRTYQKGITEEDLFRPLDEHKSGLLGAKLETVWNEEYKKHKGTALHRALFRMFGPYFMFIGLLRLINEIMTVVVLPLSIGRLVSFFEKNQTIVDETEAYVAGTVFVSCLVTQAFINHPNMMALMHMTMKMRVACSSLVYRKMLKLSRTALASTTVGQLVNLLTNDVSKFDQGFILAHFCWVGPIQAVVGVYLMYQHVGYSTFFGVAFLLSFIPLQFWMGKRTSTLRLRTALRTDERVRLMNEIISGIQVIKMYCWEKPFAKLIDSARVQEMRPIKDHAFLLGLVFSFESFVTRTCTLLNIVGYVLFGNYITAEKLFAITAVYNVLKPVITILFSTSIASLAEVNVSVIRIHKFLRFEEREVDGVDESEDEELETKPKDKKTKTRDKKAKAKEMEANRQLNKANLAVAYYPVQSKIVLENVVAKWSENSAENTLESINLNISWNQTVAVIGSVGSGKSSLLNVILKELPVISGKLEVQGAISYSSQEPWLFSASVRQNILFGSDYDEERYMKVVEVCALKSDFELFPYGDKTLVGERGTALSGGQKARINLARCVYKKADIYLLDDPLSAVDSNVGRHLYDNCIGKFLHDKICIITTHQLQYLSNADKIVIMDDGTIEMEGNYNDLQNSGLDFVTLLQKFNNEEAADDDIDKKSMQIYETVVSEEEDEDEDGPTMQKEQMKSGQVTFSVYVKYLQSGGGLFAILLLVSFFLMCQIVGNGGDYYSAYWVNSEADFNYDIENNKTAPDETFDRNPYIITYSTITAATIVFGVAHSLYCMLFFAKASSNIHHLSFSTIITATMRFFHNNPSGRILNRFSKDLGYIDEYIPPLFFEMFDCGLIVSGTLILSIVVEPWLAAPSLVLIIIFYFFRVVYIRTSRGVKRIESITRSPMFTHMTASMHGLSTIRAFKAEEILIKEFDNFQDKHSSAYFLFFGSNRCFAFWLDMLCIWFIAGCMFAIIYFDSDVYGGDMGLILTQYIGLIGSLQWGMRQWSELENNMVSVERLLEYQTVEHEPNREKPSLPENWPQHGEILFDNVTLGYNSSEAAVLKNLTFSIKSKEKIGIVGRTGAGKSSIITALFQLYPIDGKIIIDGVDTTKLPLDDVRSKISIIPQEPVLFSGTMRKNLDPFEEYNDDVLWNALDQVELKEVMEDLKSGLDCHVSEGGSNFSVGERQLVCLARALIRNNKILVMDEATANVDPETDSLIQNTIRQKFADCTVLTIAHRLHTVMDSDKILVMSAGTVQEYDHPYKLLQNKGVLHSLVQTTGKNTALNLESIAKESYEKKTERN